MKTKFDLYRPQLSLDRTTKAIAAFALICSLSVSAHAQLGSGWTTDNETYIAQNSSGTTTTAISGGYEFKIPVETGLCRAEMRGNNLPTNTTNQWQGLGTLVSFPSPANKICMHQVFGPAPSTPDLILDEATGGPTGVEIMSLEQSDAVEASITVGTQFQLNTIYDPVGNLISIYVNGALTGTKVPNSGIHYNKYGQYVSSSGAGPSTFDWVSIQSWSGGTAPGSGGTTVATPTFSPAGGTYSSAQSVTLSDSTSGATIYYTTDGSTPTTSSAVYSSAIAVNSGTVTIKALGAKSGDTNSAVASATYTISIPVVATPTFSPAGGTYSSAQSVTLSDSTSGATIYYTTDGSTPTTSSAVYSSAIAVNSTTTVKALGAKSGDTNSAVASATYTINIVGTVATPTFSPAGGTYSSAQSVTLSDSTSGATIYYTTDGSTPTTSSAVYSSAIAVNSTTTIKALGVLSGDNNSAVASATYTISIPVVATPTFSPAGGTYSTAQSVTLSDSTSGATIYYTTDGSTPTTSSAVYSSAIAVNSGTVTIKALGALSGDTNSAVASATYTISSVVTVATPTFSPAGGTYSTAQTVTISDSTSGATIYYTTNGTTPTTSSTVYSSPIAVSSGTVVIEAMAAKSGDTNSSVGSATYTISTGGGCQTATGSWTSFAATSRTGTLTATFDATPHASGITAFIGMTNGTATSKSSAAWLVKFHSTGDIQAANGSSFTAGATINWVSGSTYHFRVVANLTGSTYSVYVTPPGQAEQTLATNYAFQVAASTLDHWGMQDTGASLVVCNFAD
jgi:hypothetical protein